MIVHATRRSYGRCVLGAVLAVSMVCIPLRSHGQQQGSSSNQAAQEPQQAVQTLQEQLKAAEELRKDLEAQLARLRAEVDASQQQRRPLRPVVQATEDAILQRPQAGALRGFAGSPKETEQTHIKIFRIQHRDVQEMRQIILVLAPGSGRANIGGAAAQVSGRRAAVQPAGGLAAAGGGSADSLRVVADRRTRSLIVRATDEVLKTVEQLVASFDVPPGVGPVVAGQKQSVFTVRHIAPEQMAQLLEELGVNVTRVPNTNTLAVRGSETTLKEVGELIEALDVEGDQ